MVDTIPARKGTCNQTRIVPSVVIFDPSLIPVSMREELDC